jgi:hypothetical protein
VGFIVRLGFWQREMVIRAISQGFLPRFDKNLTGNKLRVFVRAKHPPRIMQKLLNFFSARPAIKFS